MIGELAVRDRERGFADWGTTVVLRRVSQSFDPQSGVLTEVADDREAPAIVGEGALAALGQTAGHGGQFVQVLLVRSEDVAHDTNARLLRVVHGGREYRVDEIEAWPSGGMTLLRCHSV